jgi:hypothetical protein
MIRVDRFSAVPSTVSCQSLFGIVADGRVGGIFVYVTSEYGHEIHGRIQLAAGVTQEDHEQGQEAIWLLQHLDEDNDKVFQASLQKSEMDVLLKDGKAVGYTFRDNPLTLALLQVLNGDLEQFPQEIIDMIRE